jgi:hypothetical protein
MKTPSEPVPGTDQALCTAMLCFHQILARVDQDRLLDHKITCAACRDIVLYIRLALETIAGMTLEEAIEAGYK